MAAFFAHVRALSPLGPIFGKELRTTARRRRTYVLRIAYLATLLLVLLFVYAVSSLSDPYLGAAERAQRNAEMGAIFFMAFSMFTMGAMGLVGPVLTCTAVNSERLRKTLPVLLSTPINTWQIVAGKLFSRLLIAFTLIGLSLPVLSVVRLLGGVEISQMLVSLALCATVAITGACIALFFSTLMNRVYAVILLAYACMFIMWFLAPMLAGMLVSLIRPSFGARMVLLRILTMFNPGVTLTIIVAPIPVPFTMASWGWCILVHLAFSTVLLLLSAMILRRMARRENEGRTAASPQEKPASSPSGHRASRAGSAEMRDNPVRWRELRRKLLARNWQAILAAVIVVTCLIFIYAMMGIDASIDDREAQMPFACIFCGLLTVLACILSATAIAHEKESDTWTLLIATPLRPGSIVGGKLAGLLRRLMWPSLLIVGHFALFTYIGAISPPAFLVILWMTFATNALWLAFGLYLSLRLKTVTFAVIGSLLAPVVVYGISTMIIGIVGLMVSGREEWAEVPGLWAPYFYMCGAIDEMDRIYPWGSTIWMPVFRQVSHGTFYGWVVGIGVAHLIAAKAILRHTVRSFDRIVGRAGGPIERPQQLICSPIR